MNSIRRRLSLTLALVLLAAGVLLAFALRDFPRRMVEEHVLARLDHDADLLYVHLLDALARQEGEAALETSLLAAAGPGYDLPLSGHYFVVRLGERQWRSRSTWSGAGCPCWRGRGGRGVRAGARRGGRAGGASPRRGG